MKIRVLAFASAREALGADELEYDLPAGGDLAALREGLIAHDATFEELWPRLAIAIDGRLVRGNIELVEGQEVALLPPVSGGLEERQRGGRGDERHDPPGGRAALVDGPIEVAEVVAGVASPRRGAVVVFLGNVRNSHGGRPVERLTYDAYRPLAAVALQTIVEELNDDAADIAVAIHHRLGIVEGGETSVAIVAAAPHRAAAYAASRTALERLKREVAIWKREHYADGEAVWREEEALTAG